jgi:hypothetical protein
MLDPTETQTSMPRSSRSYPVAIPIGLQWLSVKGNDRMLG